MQLPQTGEIDNTTLAMMNTPRCEMPDIIQEKYTLYSEYIKYLA